MAINQQNIPKASQVKITLTGVGDFQDQTTAISPSGGEYDVTSFSALDGSVFTNTGSKSPYVMEFTSIYTDGVTGGDLYTYLLGKHGQDVTVIFKPKGATSTRTFTLSGLLYRLDVPSASASDNSMNYTWAVSGSLTIS